MVEAGASSDAAPADAAPDAGPEETLEQWAAGVCAGFGRVIFDGPVELKTTCYPSTTCEWIVPIRVANCGTVARNIGVVDTPPDANSALPMPAMGFDDIAPGGAIVVPFPIRTAGRHRIRAEVAPTMAGGDGSVDWVTVDVRDAALEQARKEYCSDLSSAGVLDAGAPPPPRDGVELTLYRTPCYGRCPSYAVTLRTDGSVIYEGASDVRIRGRVIDVVAPAIVASLIARFDAAAAEPPVKVLPGSHCTRVVDAPQAHVMLLRGGTKRPMPRLGHCEAPHEHELAAAIDRATRSERWVTGSIQCKERGLW